MNPSHKELILGGQRSGKTRRAEAQVAQWLQQSVNHRAVYVATAYAHDEEMRQRIARHQQDRAARVPRMQTVESTAIATVLQTHSQADTAIVVDCLTLWLTHWLMPWQTAPATQDAVAAHTETLLRAIADTQAQLFIVSNEIGLGVVAADPATRAFVDALGLLNQRVAAVCNHVTLMAAGLPLALKQEK
ncbi:MAG: bifunctional adenosylcobinamide kinase/adenosylcobinamide-phosphate guanylyltransferase [Brachymonas sp.]|nr:bifunctional adenosylcobinamide kinase/adenosylcobinamide-phosphate guanylyltransferase [Brachymonas sp.]